MTELSSCGRRLLSTERSPSMNTTNSSLSKFPTSLTLSSFTSKLMSEVSKLNENTEDLRGELAESIKQRKRERADLVTYTYSNLYR